MSGRCLNCGAPLTGPYCARCGQRVEDRRRPLLAVLRDVADEWLALDAKLPRSLARLLRPGRLSELWVAGKRASYVTPWRLYLLASVVLFLVFQIEPFDATYTKIIVAGEIVHDPGPSPDGRRSTFDLFDSDPQSLKGRLERRFLGDRIERLQQTEPQELVDGFFNGLRATLPTTLILFLPLFGAALKLLYRRQKILYVDHLVFATHLQVALLLALILVGVTSWGGWLPLGVRIVLYVALFVAGMPVYLAFALKRFYRQGWRWTVLKTMLVYYAYFQVARLVMVLTIVLIIRRI